MDRPGGLVRRRARFGFTLIELMIVVAIIGLLAAIAIPKFANLVIKAKEASVKGKLGAIRSAISIYYANNEGTYPEGGIYPLTIGGKYLDTIPKIAIPTVPMHEECNIVSAHLDTPDDTSFQTATGVAYKIPGSGATPPNPASVVWVNCTHTDSKGITWSFW